MQRKPLKFKFRLAYRLARKALRARVKTIAPYFNPLSRIYSLGARGERVACRFLKKSNYLIWERNYRCYFGEVDIIASKGRTLVFVEVKTRSEHTAKSFPGIQAVDAGKIERINKVALEFTQEHTSLLRRHRTLNMRIEVVEVVVPKRFKFRAKANQLTAVNL